MSKLKFPLREPRESWIPCVDGEEFRQRVAFYTMRILFDAQQIALGETGATERYQVDDESLREIQTAQSALLLALERATIVPRSRATESDGEFQRFMGRTVGPVETPRGRKKK